MILVELPLATLTHTPVKLYDIHCHTKLLFFTSRILLLITVYRTAQVTPGRGTDPSLGYREAIAVTICPRYLLVSGFPSPPECMPRSQTNPAYLRRQERRALPAGLVGTTIIVTHPTLRDPRPWLYARPQLQSCDRLQWGKQEPVPRSERPVLELQLLEFFQPTSASNKMNTRRALSERNFEVVPDGLSPPEPQASSRPCPFFFLA